jgi:hypothetical protein
VKSAVFLLLMPIVATVSIGCGCYASAGAATSRPSQFCTSLKPGVKAGQQLAPILGGMSSHAVAKTKSQLLTEINTILKSFRSVKVQIGSAPANVRTSYRWDVLTEGKVKTALGRAATKRQIQAAVREIASSGGTIPREAPFIFYVQSQCGSTASTGAPATP